MHDPDDDAMTAAQAEAAAYTADPFAPGPGLSEDERKHEIRRFTDWLINVDDGLVFARSSGDTYQRHEVDPDIDLDPLYARFRAWEEDQGCAAAEAAHERMYDR